jgi:chromate transporter
MTPASPLGELARVFGRLGAVSVGGPAAHIALMQDEIVHRRKWISADHFLALLGAASIIPGPNSTELAIYIGHARGGWRGLLVAGGCFIAPAVIIVLIVAWAYVTFGALPAVDGMLYGIRPVVLAIVAQALWRLGRTAVKSWWLALLMIAATVAIAAGIHELLVLALAAAAGLLVATPPIRSHTGRIGALALLAGGQVSAPAAAALAAGSASSFSLGTMFLLFLKIGAVLFGSGYVLLAFLRADFVVRLGWLTEDQLLDAVAVGQITPGPVFTTATFIGYVLGGPFAALAATAAIFAPAFVYVALSISVLERLRASRVVASALDAVNVASVALMLVVSWQLANAALVDPLAFVLAGASVAVLLSTRINSAWLIAAGASIGILVR